jgi:hypothetical protein
MVFDGSENVSRNESCVNSKEGSDKSLTIKDINESFNKYHKLSTLH